ncbi:MAG: hypothetical protein HY059_06215 [Proteobacteria bacterium]|nr:hypothetical protein [Pseudomonadota bacterium]
MRPLTPSRMSSRLARWTVIAALAAGACSRAASDSLVPGPGVSNLLAGSWAQDGGVIGSAFNFTLTTKDTVVTGTGHYAIEAGRSGSLTVTGSITSTHVALDFAYDYGAVSHFDGTPPTATQLAGAIKYGPKDSMVPSYAISFHKTP